MHMHVYNLLQMLKSMKLLQAVIPGTPNDAREGGLYVRSASRQARVQHSDVRRALIRFFFPPLFVFGLLCGFLNDVI